MPSTHHLPYHDIDLDIQVNSPQSATLRVVYSPVGEPKPLTVQWPDFGDTVELLNLLDVMSKQPENVVPTQDSITGRELLRNVGWQLFQATLGAWGQFEFARHVAEQNNLALRV